MQYVLVSSSGSINCCAHGWIWFVVVVVDARKNPLWLSIKLMRPRGFYIPGSGNAAAIRQIPKKYGLFGLLDSMWLQRLPLLMEWISIPSLQRFQRFQQMVSEEWCVTFVLLLNTQTQHEALTLARHLFVVFMKYDRKYESIVATSNKNRNFNRNIDSNKLSKWKKFGIK